MAPKSFATTVRSALLPGTEPATALLALFGVGFFVLTGLQSGSVWNIAPFTALRAGANFWPWTLHGEPWRLVSYGFLHGGLVHIFFNTYALLGVAPLVERRFGTPRFVLLWFAAVVCGGLASALFTRGFSVGASGGVLGVLGAGIVATHRMGTSSAHAVRNQLIGWSAVTIAFGLAGGQGGHKFDNGAHLGGLAVGLVLGFVFARFEARSPRVRQLEKVAAAAVFAGALTIGVGTQIALRNVPASAGSSGASEAATRAQAWQDCRASIVPAVAPTFAYDCQPFAYTFWEYSARYQLMAAAYAEAGNTRAAANERARAAALFGDSGIADVLGPRATIDNFAALFDREVLRVTPQSH
jgi:membrane associated rhomboid family serine protease